MRRRRPSPRRKLWLALGTATAIVVVVDLVRRNANATRTLPPVALHVQAIDTSQRPVAACSVAFYPRKREHEPPVHETRTNEQGVAELPVEKARGGFYCLARDAAGIVTQTWVSQAERAPYPLKFAPPTPIRGMVVDSRGLPVRGADVFARFVKGPPLERTKTDSLGRFLLERISGAIPHVDVIVRAKGYADSTKEWSRACADSFQFELVTAPPVRLRVLDPRGAPLANAAIAVEGRPDLGTTTDARGSCSFAGIDPESRIFLRLASTRFTYRCDGFQPLEAEQTLQLERGGTLQGQILDTAGDPMIGIEVRHRHGPRAWVRVKTGAFGRFKIGDLPSGKTEVFYELPSGVVYSFFVRLEEGETRDALQIRVPAN